ncbi:MAG: hypothetical protein PHE15_02755 [Dehalococcoidales bacterium]|nr:hypothetical protein [Dehalococcoidales bacterium]
MGSVVTMLGASITGPMMLAFKNAEKYSAGVSNQIQRMKGVTLQFQISIANALVPIMEKFTNILGNLLNAWNKLGPVVQQQIIQGAFMVGVFLTIGGGAIWLVGKLTTLIGTVINLGAKFLGLMLANIPLTIIIASVAILIVLMFKFKAVADVVMSTLEVLFLFFMNGLEAIRLVFSRALAFILGGLEKLYTVLGKIPGPLGKMYQSIAAGVKTAREELDKFGNQALPNLERNTQKIGQIFSTGEGDWSRGFDDLKNGISGAFDWLGKLGDKFTDIKTTIYDWGMAVKDIIQNLAQGMENAMSDLFFNVITGQFDELGKIISDFGNQMLKMIVQVLMKMLLINTIGNIGMGKFGKLAQYFHEGGIIRAHSGLAVDEVPIIAQTGEGVLSRKGMSALGRSNFDRLNRGESMGGEVVNQPIVVIQAWDTRDIQRNAKALESIISNAMDKNSPSMRKFKRR